MKVLVATKLTQGQRGNDFSHADEGELLGFTSECDGEPVDGKCGCRRAFSGLVTHRATTTAQVVERPELDLAGYVKAMRASLASGGWTAHMSAKEADAWAREDATELARMAEAFPVGMIVEKRGAKVQERRVAKARGR